MILLIVLLILLIAAGVLIYLGVYLSKAAFLEHFDGGGDYYPYYSRLHPNWQREAVSFPNNHGDTLRGFLFSYPEVSPKALMVLYHGYGMSLSDYLPECEYFTRRGYLVLAFDGSGTGFSDGVLYGLPQHILDLQYCLRYVQSAPQLSCLPLVLYGHSWGGFACDAVGALERFPIRGIVSAAGFACATSALGPYVERKYGLLTYVAMVGVHLYQRILFGKVAGISAVDGLRQQTCPVLIIQSDDDGIIRFEENYGEFYRAFQNDPNKTFLPLKGKNHNLTTPPEIDREKRKMLKTLRSGNIPEEVIEKMNELKTHVDYDLLEQIADFLDDALK